ncbi:MAG: radical SAM protein, partial [Pseudomonadota bacterium]
MPEPPRNQQTRICVDPWQYVEVAPSGGVLPCCNYRPIGELSDDMQSLSDVIALESFEALRASLLAGDLSLTCQKCHIRKMGPVDALKTALAENGHARGGHGPDLTRVPTEIRVDLTTRCNLRCNYCAVSAPGYQGFDMEEVHFERLLRLLKAVPREAAIHLNGHGETTYHPEWMKAANAVIGAGHRPHMITNLARTYSDEEFACLAHFGVLQISLDSLDEALMKRIRKPVRVRLVIENMLRVSAAASTEGIPPPRLYFSTGLYDPAIWTLENFATIAVQLGVSNMTFWNLVRYPHQTLVRPISEFSAEESAEARKILARTRAILDAGGV